MSSILTFVLDNPLSFLLQEYHLQIYTKTSKYHITRLTNNTQYESIKNSRKFQNKLRHDKLFAIFIILFHLVTTVSIKTLREIRADTRAW